MTHFESIMHNAFKMRFRANLLEFVHIKKILIYFKKKIIDKGG